MSNYYNSFRDGPNDPPFKKPKKQVPYGWSNVLKNVTKTGLGSNVRRKEELDRKIKESSE